jgi:hypothetical protein
MINKAALSTLVQELAALPGTRGCALVDATAGMIWAAHGELAANQSLWEAAADHWRLHVRNQEHFACLGTFGAVATYHSDGVMAVFRCSTDPELLFVAVGRHRAVDWPRLQRMGLRVGQLVRGET